MKLTKYLLASGLFTLGAAMAASNYHLKITTPTWVNGNELKPGDYRVQVESDKVMITGRDTNVEAPAKINTAEKKFSVTSTRSSDASGQHQLEEIDFGGSKTSVVLKSGSNGVGGSE